VASTGWFAPVHVAGGSRGGSMENEHLRVSWDAAGRLTSIVAKSSPDLDGNIAEREVLPPGRVGAELSLAPDHPVEYDAWDLERWTRRRAVPLPDPDEIRVVANGPLVAEVQTTQSFGSSKVITTYSLRAGSRRLDITYDIDWHESEKLLAVDFPLDVHSAVARCGIQFGHVERPRHENTSWDLAKFEVCAHRWVDISEPSFGVAILNDGRFGHAVQGDGVRVSLLRAPNSPDPGADRGRHRTTLSVFPHTGALAEVVTEAERLNVPVRLCVGTPAISTGWEESPFRGITGVGIEVSALKLADDGSGDVVVRLAEVCGDRQPVGIAVADNVHIVEIVDIFEAPTGKRVPLAQSPTGGRVATVALRPFELVTVRIRRG
jgi:alpha-mannosidase